MIIDPLIDLALAEDTAAGDITTEAILSSSDCAVGWIRAKESLVMCGLEPAGRVFRRVDARLSSENLVGDGCRVENGQAVMRVEGPAESILTAERTALNFLQYLSGIATRANQFAQIGKRYGVRICDTRKTHPGFRVLAKYAVRCGGCHNHRATLADHVLIKDNHIVAAGSLSEAVRRARAHAPHTAKIEVETDTLEQVEEALRCGADIILLDNMDPEMVTEARDRVAGRSVLEVSGGVSLENIEAYAATGVDVISVGEITHSSRAVDLSLGLQLITASQKP